jgi:hypothetical protein
MPPQPVEISFLLLGTTACLSDPVLQPVSARKQSEFSNCDLGPYLEMLYIRKEEHSNLIKLADL